MTHIFVCEWSQSVLETDDEGEDRHYLEPVYYSDHTSLEEAISYAGKGYLGYGMLTKKITAENSNDYWEPVCCICVLEYQNGSLVGKHNQMDFDWRFYEVREHWKDYWPNLISYPPVIKENDSYI